MTFNQGLDVAMPITTPPRQPVRLQLKDEAAAHIRELIISGQVSPGQLLRLAPLAERIGASVTPVREALLLLAQDGWVTQEPNRGFRVMMITRRDVEDAYLVQSFVTGELAARAAVLIADDQIAVLRMIDAEIGAHTADDQGFLESANFRLHDTIYAAADSDRLTWFVRSASRFVPRRFWGLIPGWIGHNREGHRALIESIESRNADGARVAMSTHIDAAGRLLLAHLDASGFWAVETSP
jgi:DNA-binding GntR family transcriptional regulator